MRAEGPDFVSGNRIYKKLREPGSWWRNEEECSSSGGHLVSLGSKAEEDEIRRTMKLIDIWTGGNMCQGSPAPSHSIWTDGSNNEHANFAKDSKLEGDRCCIKSGLTGWRGGDCKEVLHGVCEAEATEEELLAAPEKVFVEGGKDMLAVRWKRSQQGWSPTRWEVTCCHIRSLNEITDNDQRRHSHQKVDCVTETLVSKSIIIPGLRKDRG